MAETVYFSLGSNLGDRAASVEAALRRLEADGICRNLEASRLYETEPLHFRRQPWFINMAARGETTLSPVRLLSAVHAIERALGRTRKFPFAPRTIDIDILLFGARRIDRRSLVIPHPRLHERRFVLVPLLELDPFIRDPVTGEPYWKALSSCPPGGVYFHSVSRYTVRSLIPLGDDGFAR